MQVPVIRYKNVSFQFHTKLNRWHNEVGLKWQLFYNANVEKIIKPNIVSFKDFKYGLWMIPELLK